MREMEQYLRQRCYGTMRCFDLFAEYKRYLVQHSEVCTNSEFVWRRIFV